MTAVKYLVQGSVRGVVGVYDSAEQAHQAKARDARRCKRMGGGAYSDAKVWRVEAESIKSRGAQSLMLGAGMRVYGCEGLVSVTASFEGEVCV